MAGNGHTSRVRKGDGKKSEVANISNTGIGHFLFRILPAFAEAASRRQEMWISDLNPQSAIRISQLENHATRPF